MPGPHFPIQIPRERLGDDGPEVKGDQKMGPDGTLSETHRGSMRNDREIGLHAYQVEDRFAWEPE